MGIFKYITLGFEVLNAVTTIMAMVKVPALLTPEGVWGAVQPVLGEVASITGAKINMDLALKITTDAVDAIQAALHKAPSE